MCRIILSMLCCCVSLLHGVEVPRLDRSLVVFVDQQSWGPTAISSRSESIIESLLPQIEQQAGSLSVIRWDDRWPLHAAGDAAASIRVTITSDYATYQYNYNKTPLALRKMLYPTLLRVQLTGIPGRQF